MLVLSRKKNESIVINNDITVTVVEIRGDKVRLGIVAPKEVPVHRQEVYEAFYGGPPGGLAPAPALLLPAPQGPDRGRELKAEADWLACVDPRATLDFVRGRASR